MRKTFGVALAFLFCATVVTLGQTPKSLHAMGRVTAIAADSITIKPGESTLTFEVNSSTTVIGKGVGTKTREMKGAGKSTAITDLVEQYDVVAVEYHDAGNGKLQAKRIDIRAKREKTR